MKKTIFTIITSMGVTIASFGQVASYSFNNGNANDGIGSNNGFINGATLTTDRFGNVNHAYSFDGIDDYIDFGDAAEFQMDTNDFSISLWLKYDNAQEAMVISKRAGSVDDYSQYNLTILNDYQAGGISKKVYHFSRSNPSSDRAILASSDLSGAWHHIVIVCNYSDSSSVYVDGVFVGSNNNTYIGNNNVTGFPLVAGYSSESNSLFYKGLIDDILIYKTVLSEQQIDSLYNLPNPITASINDEKNGRNLIIFPNPTLDYLTVNTNEKINKASIYTINGSLVQTLNTLDNKINVSNLSQGMYILMVQTDKGITQNKFIKE